MRVLCIAALVCLFSLCFAQKQADFPGHPRNLTIDFSDTSLDVFAKTTDDPEVSIYTLQVRVGDDSEVRIRFTYYTEDAADEDLEFITADNVTSVDYAYTYRVRLISLIEYEENDTATGFDFKTDSDEENTPNDIVVREQNFADLTWDSLDELKESPTDDGARHFAVTGRNLQDGHSVTITFHVGGEDYTVGDQTFNPDSIKIDFAATYTYVQAESGLALFANLDAFKLDDEVTDVDGLTDTKQVVLQEHGYLAWLTDATTEDGASFSVNNTDVARADPPHPQDSIKNDDHVYGERAYRIAFSFISDYRNDQNQIVFTWDPEIGNGRLNAAGSLTVSYGLLLVAAFVHVVRRLL